MHDLDLTSLRLFVCVCETGNMSRAADKSGMVASAVSKRLAQLEHVVGVPVLARQRGGLRPTPAGETLLGHARSILLSASRIERDMTQHAAGLQGRVNVLATASAMAESLADDLAEFLKAPAHANIHIDLEERVSPEVVRGVREGVAAIGICWDAAETSLLQTRPYRQDRLCVVVPKGHALARVAPLRFADTLDYEHVCMPANSAVTVMLQREAHMLGRPLKQRVIVTNFEAAMRVVRSGLGIALVPEEVTRLSAGPYGLDVLTLNEPWAPRQFVLCHRGEAQLGAAAGLLLEFLASPPAHAPHASRHAH